MNQIRVRWRQTRYSGVDFPSVSQSSSLQSCRTSLTLVLLQVDFLVWSVSRALIHLSSSSSIPFFCRCILKPICRCWNVQIKLIGHYPGSSRGLPGATHVPMIELPLISSAYQKPLEMWGWTRTGRHQSQPTLLCCTITLSHDRSTKLAQVGYLWGYPLFISLP